MDLQGKTIVVTGAGSGIGRCAALGLASQGAHVVCVARSSERIAPTLQEVTAVGGSAEAAIADLSLMADVRRLAEQIRSRRDRIDVLINNAAIWQARREVTPEGFEKTWAVNVLAPHLLAQGLIEPLRAARGRVVNLSSEEHLNGRIRWEDTQFAGGFSSRHAYRQSKLALTMLTLTLAQRERESLTVNCLHPGIVGSQLFRNFPAFIRFWIKLLMRKPQAGAAPVIRLALAPEVAGATGGFYVRHKLGRPHGIAMNEPSRARLWELVSTQLTSS